MRYKQHNLYGVPTNIRAYAIAYNDGRRAAIRGRGTCPYPQVNRARRNWWYAGYNDTEKEMKP